jgi:hypothetical protein
MSIDEGIQIDSSAEQPSNAESPRIERRQQLSNVNCDRRVQARKHLSEMISMDEGIQIDSSDEQPSNPDSPKFKIRQPPSKINRVR